MPHSDDAKDGLDTMPTEQCVGAVNAVLLYGDMALAKRATALEADQRTCLAALAVMDCIEALLKDLMTLPLALKNAERQNLVSNALRSAAAWVDRACPPERRTTEIVSILRDMERGNQRGGSWVH